MPYLKRQWKPLTIVGMSIFLGVGFWWYRASATGAAVMAVALFDAPHDPPTDLERSQVESLLESLSLDRDALVALNLSSQQGEDLLAAVRTFNASNRAALDTRLASLAEARSHLRSLERAIRNGTAGENPQGQWNDAVAAVVTAQNGYDAQLGTLRSSLSDRLSESQVTAWANLKSGWGGALPLRMLSLSAGQKGDLASASDRYEHTLAEATSDQDRAAAVSAWNSAVDGVLTQDQKTVCEAYVSQYVTASAAVAEAFAAVLPKE